MQKNMHNTKNSFAGKKMMTFNKSFIYPKSGSMRFQINLDKQGQVIEIKETFAHVIKDVETKKSFVKITYGERPRRLYEHIKGQPFANAVPWIDDYIETALTANEQSSEN